MQDSTDRYRRATLALAEALGFGDLAGVGISDMVAEVERLKSDRAALAEELAGCVRQRDEARQVVDELHNQVGALTRACVELAADRRPTHTPEAPWVTSLRAQLDAARRIAEVEGLRQRDAALAGRPVSALDDGRRLVRVDGGDREAMAEVLVEAFVDGDPETCQTIVDKLGEQSEH